jgi:hypothetical protein
MRFPEGRDIIITRSNKMSDMQNTEISYVSTKGITFELPEPYIGQAGINLSIEYAEAKAESGTTIEYVTWVHVNSSGAVKWFIRADSIETNTLNSAENERALISHILEDTDFAYTVRSLLGRIGTQKEAKEKGVSVPSEWDIRFPIPEGSTIFLVDRDFTLKMDTIGAGVSFAKDGKTCIMPLRDLKRAVELGRVFKTAEEADALFCAEHGAGSSE